MFPFKNTSEANTLQSLKADLRYKEQHKISGVQGDAEQVTERYRKHY